MKIIKKNISKSLNLVGNYRACFYKQENKILQKWNDFIIGIMRKTNINLKNLLIFSLQSVDYRKNVICVAGMTRLAKALAGNNTNLSETTINYCALGTGAGTPTTNDTTLFTESYRNLPGSRESSDNLVYMTAYFTPSETSGTFTEFGTFIDATATANSGQLFGKLGSLNWVKDSSTYLLVDIIYTLQTV